MAVKHLDRTRSFGEVFGDLPSRRYVQDGLYFDAAGEHRAEDTPDVAKPRGPGRPRKAALAEVPGSADLSGFVDFPEN